MDGLSYSASHAFRKLGFAANELLDYLEENRAAAAKALHDGVPFDWKTAAERLERLERIGIDECQLPDDTILISGVGLSFYLEPCEPAISKVTPGKTMTVAEVDGTTALDVLRKLARNTSKAFWFFLNMTDKGTKKLQFSRHQRKVFEDTGFLSSITALNRSEVRELRKHLVREIADAEVAALEDTSRHPADVARRKFDSELMKIYWSDIGYSPSPNGQKELRTKKRGLNVQKVQGSERSFRVCRETVIVSPKSARILDAIISLQEDRETINPKNVMLKAGYKLTKDERKTFEDDKGRLNKVLKDAVEKGLYVKDDGEFRLQKPPTTRNKKTARRR